MYDLNGTHYPYTYFMICYEVNICIQHVLMLSIPTSILYRYTEVYMSEIRAIHSTSLLQIEYDVQYSSQITTFIFYNLVSKHQ